MDDHFLFVPSAVMNKLAIAEITHCNDTTARFGLILSPTEAQELVETRAVALDSSGRIEFAGGIINKLIIEFCDSPFLFRHNYARTLNELVEIFYYYKSEMLDEISDDELIKMMKTCFDGACHGSIELLQNRELDQLARDCRDGIRDAFDMTEEWDARFDQEDDDE